MLTRSLASFVAVLAFTASAVAQPEQPGAAPEPPAPVDAPAPELPEVAVPPEDAPEPVRPPVAEPPPPAPVRVYNEPPNLEVPAPRPLSTTAYRHDGFYLRSTLSSLQYTTFKAKGPDGSKTFDGLGASTSLALGGTVSEGLVIGGTFSASGLSDHWEGLSDEGDDIGLVHSQLGVLVDWFPESRGGWHVGGSIGLGVNILQDDDDDQFTGVGASASVLGGYDFWIGPQWALGILATGTLASSADLKDDDQDDTGLSLSAASIGIGASLLHH
jgi:hypothetical protein